MPLLVVGSVALDTVETPFGRAEDALGGSATFFSAAASSFCPVQLVGVIGDDFPAHALDFLAERDVDLSGLEYAAGESFRWSGVYSFDLNSRETLETRLGVFADFNPRIPASFRSTEWVFLGNIDPVLQLGVLDQIDRPRLVACDTMNFWIQGKREELLAILARVDLLMVNDAEARELSGDHNLGRAARWIQEQGPRYVIIKKGEHGAILFTQTSVFFAPGYPLEEVFDPTGAGDAFAGGLMGYLARRGSVDQENIRRAMVYGAAMGSYAVEQFGIRGFEQVTLGDVERRVRAFQDLTHVELAEGIP
jgi:sugar/nucleoside kinase (ribokinase family)